MKALSRFCGQNAEILMENHPLPASFLVKISLMRSLNGLKSAEDLKKGGSKHEKSCSPSQ